MQKLLENFHFFVIFHVILSIAVMMQLKKLYHEHGISKVYIILW